MHSVAFPPILPERARLLILGSMPGAASLQHRQYYAHPRNSFWPIMENLLDQQPAGYRERAGMLMRHGIALWDVLQSCYRQGSLDTAIRGDSIVVNDFNALFTQQPGIRCVYFNGSKAEQEFRRRVLPALDDRFHDLQYIRLPSTSPAMASLNFEQKLVRWRAAIGELK